MDWTYFYPFVFNVSNLAISIMTHKNGPMFGYSNSSLGNDTKEIIWKKEKVIKYIDVFFFNVQSIFIYGLPGLFTYII